MPATREAIEKSISLDLMFERSIYQQTYDEELVKALLDRFLSVTGFSRSLRQNLTVVQQLGVPGS